MKDLSPKALLVMFKPDGDHRMCARDEVTRINNGWNDVLTWLRGADPDDLAYTDLVEAVAQKAGLRVARFAEYDVRDWAAQARTLADHNSANASTADALPLLEIVSAHLVNAGFTLTQTGRTWLNRVAIELLYRDAPGFDHNRELLVSRLLKGPVTIQSWHGERHGLALALKLLVRCALSSDALTNLVHIDSVSAEEVGWISKSLGVSL